MGVDEHPVGEVTAPQSSRGQPDTRLASLVCWDLPFMHQQVGWVPCLLPRPRPIELTRLGLGREFSKTLKFQMVPVSLLFSSGLASPPICGGGEKGEQAGMETALGKQREELSLFLLNTNSRRCL